MNGHKKRVEKVRDFFSHNKLFSILVVILIGFLLFRTVSHKTEEQPTSTQGEQTVSTESNDLEWRFYPIDLVVLGIGGGICAVMAIRERKKAKEGLN